MLAAINTTSAQKSFEAASVRWHLVADRLCAKVPKLTELRRGFDQIFADMRHGAGGIAAAINV